MPKEPTKSNVERIVNAITVDVEDYFQVSAFSKDIDKNKWSDYESRVERNTHILLELFDQYNTKGTFFVLGWIAERYPNLIKDIMKAGHEIASHGYSHELIYNQQEAEFREETRRTKDILENIIGQSIYGYRAASYSIVEKSIWALDVLTELEFTYDSSIFPIVHDRYGIPGAKTEPHVYKTERGNSIIEFPISTVGVGSTRIPISGGGYFRLLPYWLTCGGLKKINNQENAPFIFYMHPWEIDTEQPRIKSNIISEFRHYNNISKFEERLRKLLQDFQFSTVSDVLKINGFRINKDKYFSVPHQNS
jgi:polysaccharide deacetylase family protein (PEP-CTERM system associated)